MQAHYPKWELRHSLRDTFAQIAAAWHQRLGKT
jgi:hypothetical protein